MNKTCRQCTQSFEITQEDLKFYDKISPIFDGKKYEIPLPTLCPSCRQQRRLAFRNERKLYLRKCDLTGKEIISVYSSDKPYKVFNREVWWSDQFDPLKYGQDFDFQKPFFEQFVELLSKVPRISLNNKEPENSEYCNFSLKNKNCYLLITSMANENCFYSKRIFHSREIFESYNVSRSELCYEISDCEDCYHCVGLQNCKQCTDCYYSLNLKNCKDCFGCSNLINARFCIDNKQFTEEEYRKKIGSLVRGHGEIREYFQKKFTNVPRKFSNGTNNENWSGDNISNSKNAHDCFEGSKLQDCKFAYDASNLKDCYDNNNNDNSELSYENVGAEQGYLQCFNDISWFVSEANYCSLCFNSKNIFGSVGLKKNQYVILNKQYNKEEYEALVPKIIEQMKKNGEWGEFFPVSLSPFGYNETVAQEYFPLEKADVSKLHAKWKEDDALNRYQGHKAEIPKDITQVSEAMIKQILTCENCSKNYKVIPSELKFYQKMRLPFPGNCPDCRHKLRLSMRNPRKLFARTCMKCSASIQTTYTPDRPEIVYCEKCYLEAVY